MSGNGGLPTIDALVDALMDYIEEASPDEVEQFAVRGGDTATVLAEARAAVSRAMSEVAQARRDNTQEKMRMATLGPVPDVSSLSLKELRKIFARHVANDDASATMAARNENGLMDEAELRSVVADILRLRETN